MQMSATRAMRAFGGLVSVIVGLGLWEGGDFFGGEFPGNGLPGVRVVEYTHEGFHVMPFCSRK